jgi:hypothetical protein
LLLVYCPWQLPPLVPLVPLVLVPLVLVLLPVPPVPPVPPVWIAIAYERFGPWTWVI